MKDYLDEDVNPAVAQILRQQGIDALSVHENGGRGLPDADHLANAAADGRCLVTACFSSPTPYPTISRRALPTPWPVGHGNTRVGSLPSR